MGSYFRCSPFYSSETTLQCKGAERQFSTPHCSTAVQYSTVRYKMSARIHRLALLPSIPPPIPSERTVQSRTSPSLCSDCASHSPFILLPILPLPLCTLSCTYPRILTISLRIKKMWRPIISVRFVVQPVVSSL